MLHVSLGAVIIIIIIIIIIINFYGAYILRNLSSEAQQNRIIKHNREQGRAKALRERGTTEDLWWKCNSEEIYIDFFSENSYSFRCLQSDGEFIPDPRRAATEKARLSFVLGTLSCCEIDALSCLGIFERCRILGRYGGCCID